MNILCRFKGGFTIPVIRFINHGKSVLEIAKHYGWLPGARYTNLRDIRSYNHIGFIDIQWSNYNFVAHLEAVKKTKPLFTVAKDVINISELDNILEQASLLSLYCEKVIVVPKDIKLSSILNSSIPEKFLLGYSVPTKYGGTLIEPRKFKRPVHLLGGRPDIQRELAEKMPVISFDCNRFTLDARFGNFFDGKNFKRHPVGGYMNCINDSIKNINRIWDSYSGIPKGGL